MADVFAKHSKSDNNGFAETFERPAKRARVATDGQVDSSKDISTIQDTASVSDHTDNEEKDNAPAPIHEARASDLYLDTVSVAIPDIPSATLISLQINRAVLDFDFEKLCSVSLSNINIYGCLVCGKYFQGRGQKSYAYAHSIHEDHHVFINLETTKVRAAQSLHGVLQLTFVGLCTARWLPCLRPVP